MKSIESTPLSWDSLQLQLNSFTQKLHSALDELGIRNECAQLAIDHICVRGKEPADVAALKAELEVVGEVISAVNVNGREIFIIQLAKALKIGSWETRGVELPYPKPHHAHADGWEHVEFVLPDAENTLEGVRDAFFQTFPQLNIDTLQAKYSYSEDEPHADGDQIPNPTVGLKVNGVGIKFHAHPIQVVVGFA